MKRLLLWMALSALAAPSFAQQISGAITAQSAACATASTANSQVVLPLPANVGSVTATIESAPSFSATVQFMVSNDGGVNYINRDGIPVPSAAAVQSTTAAGTWRFDTGGFQYFKACASAFTSGTVSVILTYSPSSFSSGTANVTGSVGGLAATGSAPVGNPVLMGMLNGLGNIQPLIGSSGGLSIGTVAVGIDGVSNNLGMSASSSGWQLEQRPYIFNGTSWDRLRGLSGAVATTQGQTSADGLSTIFGVNFPISYAGGAAGLAVYPYLFNGTSMDRVRSAGVGSNVASTGIAAATPYPLQLSTGANPTLGTNANNTPSTVDIQGTTYTREGGPNVITCYARGVGNALADFTQVGGGSGCGSTPGTGLRVYVTSVTVVSTTATATAFRLSTGTGAACVTTNNPLFPANASDTYVGPINTAQPFTFSFPTPLVGGAAQRLCAIGIATNTANITITGYVAP